MTGREKLKVGGRRRAFLVALLLLSLDAPICMARTLELQDFLDLKNVSAPLISPDGKSIIYVRRHVDKLNDKWISELWMLDSDGANHRYFGTGQNAQWSPDSRRLAFTTTSNDQTAIVVASMQGSKQAQTIASTRHAIRNLRWSPDGRSIAFTATVPMQEPWPIVLPGRPQGAKWAENPLIVERLHYRIDGQGLKTGFDHVFVVPSAGGTPRQLTDGQWDVGARAAVLNSLSRLEWGKDSATLFFDGFAATESLGMASHIYRLDVASGEMQQLTRSEGFWSSPRVSQDGRQLAYLGYVGTTPDQSTYPGYQIRVMNIDGTNDRIIHEAWEGRIYTQVGAVAEFLSWRKGDGGLYVTRHAKGASNVAFLTLDGNVRTVTEGTNGFYITSLSDDGLAAGTVATPHMPENVAIATLSNGRVKQLTDVNADLFRNLTLGEVEEIWFDSDPDIRVQGWIVKPPAFSEDKKYPLVLSIHGGPHAMDGPSFNFSFQDFAARGYVVLYTNPRGSIGYGIEFANAVNDSISGKEGFNDLMAGVDAIVARGYIDENRLNVTGCSAGGLMTNWIVTQTHKFRSAAALCSISNWISFAGTSDIVIGVHHLFDKRFWEDPRSWWDHSPISHVAKVTTPTLLMTGESDLRTPIAQAEEFYVALKMRGIPTKLISMKGESHGTGRKVPSNMLRTQMYLQKWFTENGGGPES